MKVDEAVLAVARLGGFAMTGQLRAAGIGADAVQRAVLRGSLLRPRRGIFAMRTAPPAVIRALAAGGSLAASSAAAYYGMWAPSDPRLHISVRADAHLTPDPRVVLHRDRHRLSPGEWFLVSRPTCVRQCITTLGADEALAVLESAMHQDAAGGHDPIDLSALRASLPRRLHGLVDGADARSESGAETIARARLRRVGVVARPQVWIAKGIRVDLLIGDRIVVEIGSQEYHAHPDRYEADHGRAAIIQGLGFELLEFTTNQVMTDWAALESVVLTRALPLTPADQLFASTRRRAVPPSGAPQKITV